MSPFCKEVIINWLSWLNEKDPSSRYSRSGGTLSTFNVYSALHNVSVYLYNYRTLEIFLTPPVSIKPLIFKLTN